MPNAEGRAIGRMPSNREVDKLTLPVGKLVVVRPVRNPMDKVRHLAPGDEFTRAMRNVIGEIRTKKLVLLGSLALQEKSLPGNMEPAASTQSTAVAEDPAGNTDGDLPFSLDNKIEEQDKASESDGATQLNDGS